MNPQFKIETSPTVVRVDNVQLTVTACVAIYYIADYAESHAAAYGFHKV